MRFPIINGLIVVVLISRGKYADSVSLILKKKIELRIPQDSLISMD
jgi:hypothetical protein